MTFWILVGLMSVLALAFVLVPIVKPGIGRKPLLIAALVLGLPLAAWLGTRKLGTPTAATAPTAMPTDAGRHASRSPVHRSHEHGLEQAGRQAG